MPATTKESPNNSIISPLVDFWLLGGMSIGIWIVMMIAHYWRYDATTIQQHFMQLPFVFALLSIACNNPHFLVSYKFAYGRGNRFIFQNWIALIAVPALLVLTYFLAFRFFSVSLIDNQWLEKANNLVSASGIGFRFGASEVLGAEILGLSIWLMYLTVGWHYSKQVFGIFLVHARFSKYPISKLQRTILKMSVFSVAIYQFIFMADTMKDSYGGGTVQDPRFGGIYLSQIGFPDWVFNFSVFALILSAVLVLIFVFIKNYLEFRIMPPVNSVVPWLAFYIWWIPLARIPEFYFIMIPFFHSLQYLPFAFRMESGIQKNKRHRDLWISISGAAVLLAGYLAFELIPISLDSLMDTQVQQTAGFFGIAFVVFINIHHFFMDSVIWKFNQPEVKRAFFGDAA